MDRPLEPGSSWLGFSGTEPHGPVGELYGVFRRPRNDADRSAGRLAARMGALDFGAEVAEDEGRLLLAGLGGEMDMIYAAPVGDDLIAHTILPNGGGGCGPPGADGLQLGWNQTKTGALVVFGLVADTIESVDLVVAGVTHPARMGENAFGARFERTPADQLERIVFHRRDGTTGAHVLRPSG